MATSNIQRYSTNIPSSSSIEPPVPNFPVSAGVPLTTNVPNLTEDVDRRVRELAVSDLPDVPVPTDIQIPEVEELTFNTSDAVNPPSIPPIDKLIPIPKPGAVSMLDTYSGMHSPQNAFGEFDSIMKMYQSAMGAQLFGGVMGQTIPLSIGLVALSAAVQALAAIVASIPGGGKISIPKLPAFNPLTMAENLNTAFQQVEQTVRALEAQYGGLSREELDQQRDAIREQIQPLLPYLAPQRTWRFRAWFCAPEIGITTDVVSQSFLTEIINLDNPPQVIQDYIDMLEDDDLINDVKLTGQESAVYMTAERANALDIENFASSPTVNVVHLTGGSFTTQQKIIYKPVFITFKYQKNLYKEDPEKVINLPSADMVDRAITSSEVAQKIVNLNEEFQRSTQKHTGTDYYIVV